MATHTGWNLRITDRCELKAPEALEALHAPQAVGVESDEDLSPSRGLGEADRITVMFGGIRARAKVIGVGGRAPGISGGSSSVLRFCANSSSRDPVSGAGTDHTRTR